MIIINIFILVKIYKKFYNLFFRYLFSYMQKNDKFITQETEKDISFLRKRKLLRIIILLIFICLIISIILIVILIPKNSSDENKEKENIVVDIKEIKNLKYCSFSILEIKAVNLDKYNNLENKDISFIFTTQNSITQLNSDSLVDNLIKIKIPKEAISGNVQLNIEKINFNYNFSLEIINEIPLNINENISEYYGDGIRIEEDLISYTRNNYYIIYFLTVPSNCIYDVEISGSSVNNNTFINIDMDSNLTLLQNKGRNMQNLTKRIYTTNYNIFQRDKYGSFYLEENKTYYLKLSIIKTTGSYAININNIKLIPNENQNKETFGMGYSIFEFDFKNEAYFPFYPYWAMSPNYIKIENEYAEFYYNQTLYNENEGKRQYKGAELTGNFYTNQDGWYGYQFCLTDIFPKNVNGTIIAQIFNQGRVNTWAGHLHISYENLLIAFRGTSFIVNTTLIGKVDWNEWYNFIIYFKVGLNKKGRIKVWFGKNKLIEDQPLFDSGNINFGFGSFSDDETLNSSKIEENGLPNRIGCKFGLYTSEGGDKIIRFKNLKVLEYNPKGAFDLVNPCK